MVKTSEKLKNALKNAITKGYTIGMVCWVKETIISRKQSIMGLFPSCCI